MTVAWICGWCRVLVKGAKTCPKCGRGKDGARRPVIEEVVRIPELPESIRRYVEWVARDLEER